MELGAGIENETLQNLIRDCLLELNKLKFDLTELEIAKARDTTPQKIQELENHILNKDDSSARPVTQTETARARLI